MNLEALTETVSAATHKAGELLIEENIRQFREFFMESSTSSGTKQLVPKKLVFKMPVTDPVSGAIIYKKLEIPLMTLIPVNFLGLQHVSLSIETKDGEEQVVIPIAPTQEALNHLADEYVANLLNNPGL